MAPSKKELQIGAISFDQQVEILSSLSKQQVNRQDIFGRTLLHLAATIGNTRIIDALLENPHLDTTIADLESGWTALHRALSSGNVGASQLLFQRDLEQYQDRSKNSAFQVWNSSIDLNFSHNSTKGGTEVFTFGSNANHTLGFADNDDRTQPARVKIKTSRPTLRPFVIEHGAISKLHSAVIVDGVLYVCGVARGGRLGTGSNRPEFTFAPVDMGDRTTVTNVALGLDHTVAITEDGSVYTWGSNRHAQLGYSSESVQELPRKVLTSSEMKKSKITKCSASRLHTVCYNEREMFCWGTNIGQMGFTSTPDPSVGANVVEGGGITEVIPHKVRTVHGIEQVVATDIATVVLFDTHEVRVFMNGGSFRVALPSTSAKGDNDKFDVFRARTSHQIPVVIQISASSNGTVCMVTDLGTVYQFQLEKYAAITANTDETVSMNQISKQLKVNMVWTAASRQMMARHVDCSDDGSFVVCVENGSVWRRRKHKRGTSVERVPLVNRIKRAYCDSNFGSYLMIREDLKLELCEVREPELGSDLEYRLPYVQPSECRKLNQLLRGNVPQKEPNSFFPSHNVEHESDDHDDNDYERMPDIDPAMQLLVSSVNPESLMMRLRASDDSNDCMVWKCQGGVELGMRASLVKCRVPKLVSFDMVTVSSDGTLLTFSDKVELDTVIALSYYLYTDKVITSLPHKDQVLEFCSKWQLDALRAALVRLIPPTPTLQHDMDRISGGDVVISLKDGKLRAYKYLLEARSGYFESLFSTKWDRGDITVDLSHISKHVFEIVLRFIYTDKVNDLFDKTGINQPKQFIRLVLDTMRVADELSLLRLQEVCESILCHFVTVKNCGVFLKEAVECNSRQLQDRVLYYICHNVDTLLENNCLGELDVDLFDLIDNHMKLSQGKLETEHNMPQSVFWGALSDPFYHDELSSRFIPIFGGSTINNPSRERKRRQSSFAANSEKPVLTQSPKLQHTSPKASTESFAHTLATSSSSPKSSRLNAATPVKSPTLSAGNTPPVSGAKSTTPAEPPIKIGDLFKSTPKSTGHTKRTEPGASPPIVASAASPSSSSSPPAQHVKPIVIGTPKLSQKERKKLQKRRDSQESPFPAVSTTVDPKPWGGAATSSMKSVEPSDDPFAELKNKKNKRKSSFVAHESIRDIIQEEHRTVEQRQHQQSRSLKEIQQEQEFEKWWQQEAAKYQQQDYPKETDSGDNAGIKRNGHFRANSRGRGGRGRGRGERGGDTNRNRGGKQQIAQS